MDDRFNHESLQDSESLAKYMKAFAEALEKGEVVFGNSDQKLVFTLDGMIRMDVKAQKRNGKNSINFKFSWQDGGASPKKNDFFIRSGDRK